MNTIVCWHDGVQFIVPEGFEFIDVPLKDYPTFCGPGRKFGDLIVPDRLFGVNLGAACHVHDDAWAYRPKSWVVFHCSNANFLQNLHAIYMNFQDNFKDPEEHADMRRILMLYFTAVSTVGALTYWRQKE